MTHGRRDRRPATGDRRPATGDRRPATGDRRPATGDRRPATGDRRPATGDRRPAQNCTCKIQAELEEPDPVDRTRQPGSHAGHEQRVRRPHLPRPAVQLQEELRGTYWQQSGGCRLQGLMDLGRCRPCLVGFAERSQPGLVCRHRSCSNGAQYRNGCVPKHDGAALVRDEAHTETNRKHLRSLRSYS